MDESTSSPGRRVGRYVLGESLGSGGMGAVYRALDPLLGRHVALKLLHPDPELDERTRAEWSVRMLREARAAAAFTHPNVVAVYDVGTDSGSPFIAMELVSGRTLRHCVGDSAIPFSQRVRWLVDLARALAAAHRAGIVHRDVKPDNVVVTEDGNVKILDFGIAKIASDLLAPSPLATLTGAGMILGTPHYMAPEQIRSEPLDGRADEFAWGVVAFELLTGRSPWPPACEPMRLIASILVSIPPPPHKLEPAIDPRVSKVIERALAKRASDRFATMDLVADALSEAHSGPRSRPVAAHSLPRQIAVVAAFALAVGVSAGWAVVSQVRAHAAEQSASRPPAAKRRVLAVLPFDNLSGRPEDGWLRLGLADALQAKLAIAGGFDVLAPPGQAGQDASEQQAARAAREMGATCLIVGSFQKVEDQIRISTRAVDAQNEKRLLAGAEERGSMAQIFDLQDSLAIALVDKLDSGSKARAESSIRQSGTRNLAAFQAFTAGRSLLLAGRVPDAMRAFDRALAADPEYRAARATLNRVRADSHHFLVKRDGAVVETISENLKGDPAADWELTTDSGALTRAWDLDGNALAVERIAATGNQATFRVASLSREGARPSGIVYELESYAKDKSAEGLSALFHAIAKNTSGESNFMVQLPPGARVLSVLPTPIESREDEAGTFLVLREERGAFVPFAWSVVHSEQKTAIDRFWAESPSERARSIALADPRLAHHGWADDLARAADVLRACASARTGDLDRARALLSGVEAAAASYGTFFVARGQFCVASALGDDRDAAAALEAAASAAERPSELISEAYLDAIAWGLERKRVGDMARLVRSELKQAAWYSDSPFHNRLPAGDEERFLHQVLSREPGNVAASYDLALTLYQAKRYDVADEALKSADAFLGGVYVADLRARIAIARGQAAEAAGDLRKLVSYYPLTWAFTAHAVMLASAGRADEAFAFVEAQAPKTEYEPPLFWALRYVVAVLPHALRYADRIVDIVKSAKETRYGQPYRLDRIADLVEVASLSMDPDGIELSRSLVSTLKAMLADESPEACNEACLKRLGTHMCRVRGLTAVQRAWITSALDRKCD